MFNLLLVLLLGAPCARAAQQISAEAGAAAAERQDYLWGASLFLNDGQMGGGVHPEDTTAAAEAAALHQPELNGSNAAHRRRGGGGGRGSGALRITSMFERATSNEQNFLEANPYWDQSVVPVNTYKYKEPFIGKVVSVKRIAGPDAPSETCYVIIDHGGEMPYWEGQSFGVIPPGTNPTGKNGKPNSARLYFAASSRYGDDMTGTTTSLCVRRASYWCPELGAEYWCPELQLEAGADDPAESFKGVCSNFLCDAKPGDELKLTGPAGKNMLLPESENFDADLIMVATGTGIAPYRSMIRRLFVENTPAAAFYKGQAWLFLGVANSDALLFDDEFKEVLWSNPEQFRYDVALSREQTNAQGGTMHIQDKMKEYGDEIFDKLDKGAHVYFCGLKGMMPGILTMLKGVAKAKGIVWAKFLAKLKKNGQWHVEVY